MPFEEQRHFFGDEDGDELNMLFDFIGMQSIHLAMARGDARPIVRALRQRPDIPEDAAYASFLRNHDELTLDKLTESERNEVFAAFGPEPDMQLYGRGLRRRLPTMLGGDQQWLRMAYSLMFAMPGAPTLFYGEEIGMGENLAIDGRLAVRTPMQWTSGPAAGFTTAPATAACRPFPDGDFGPEAVNVAAQRTDPDSLLNWFERLIRLRKSAPEIGWGEYQVVDVGNDAVLVLQYRWDDRTHDDGAQPRGQGGKDLDPARGRQRRRCAIASDPHRRSRRRTARHRSRSPPTATTGSAWNQSNDAAARAPRRNAGQSRGDCCWGGPIRRSPSAVRTRRDRSPRRSRCRIA